MFKDCLHAQEQLRRRDGWFTAGGFHDRTFSHLPAPDGKARMVADTRAERAIFAEWVKGQFANQRALIEYAEAHDERGH
jgi:hypothetical protein